MIFSPSDRLILVISIGLVLLATGVAYTANLARHPPTPLQAVQESLDLNEVSFEELLVLPGIGPTLAQRIILYRERRGPFRSVEELVNVEGIGPKLFGELGKRLRVRESDD
jgi:competence ComEA-like helix-hairpin-helix protein